MSTHVDENECRHSNGQCDTYCVNTAGSFACSCETGFQLDDDGFTCKDYNECERSNGGCSHGCVNTLGSYACECPNTHYKEVDNKTCHGERFTDSQKQNFLIFLLLLLFYLFRILRSANN
ncbi:hypothetical protein CAPTEDRAFT_144967 [Capitella teleta]|uniref:EGF-like domain-containing protein n=1 Tax=Capitella teleta TaxID=283909 RepID=R7VAQ3_CAPTE|nr:hypothetical protein CAPTEDRAFT_144967 [Capitella teleta]|eukprot:ELU15928.1 hypothetical protein CAPTEDRAFT_144967 [Capitella teleta]